MTELELETKLENVIYKISKENNIYLDDDNIIRKAIYASYSLNEEKLNEINDIISSMDFKNFSGDTLDNFFYNLFGIERRKYFNNIIKFYARYNYDEVFEIKAGSFFCYKEKYYYIKNNIVSFDKNKTINFSVEETSKTIAESKSNFTKINDNFYIDISKVEVEGDKATKLKKYLHIIDIVEDSNYEDDTSYLERCTNFFQNSCINGKKAIKNEILKIPYVDDVEFISNSNNYDLPSVLITQSDIEKTNEIKNYLEEVFEYFNINYNIKFVDIVELKLSGFNKIFSYKVNEVVYNASSYFAENIEKITKILKTLLYDYESNVITIDYDLIINTIYKFMKNLNSSIYLDDEKIKTYFTSKYYVKNENVILENGIIENNDIIVFKNKLLSLVIENV